MNEFVGKRPDVLDNCFGSVEREEVATVLHRDQPGARDVSERLCRSKRLERAGLVERTRYQEHPPRHEYHLTQRGGSLAPVVNAMYAWGSAQL